MGVDAFVLIRPGVVERGEVDVQAMPWVFII